MPHQDEQDIRTNLQAMKAVFAELLPPGMDEFKRHGNATISPVALAATAIACWGWTNSGTLDDRIAAAAAVVRRVFHIERVGTRQGVMKALASCGDELVDRIVKHMAARVRQLKGHHWRCAGKPTFAVDGTKFTAPRTKANEACFAANASSKKRKRYKKSADESKGNTVQVLTTVLWHLGSGLPFRWLTQGFEGGKTRSETKSLQAMLDDLPDEARVIGDAAYIGYPLWSAIIDSGRSFLVRVGSNVKLLKQLGDCRYRDGFVYYWPDASLRRRQPPLTLRLITVHNGKETIYLLTNELNMTDAEASHLYRQRWGVEVFFRSVKQSCQRGKLRCQTPASLIVELNWTLIGIWAALFVGKQTLHEHGQPISRLSPVKVVRAFQTAVMAVALRAQDAALLFDQLAQSLIANESGRTTSKSSRDHPRKKKHRSCGKPILLNATAQQKQLARKYLP